VTVPSLVPARSDWKRRMLLIGGVALAFCIGVVAVQIRQIVVDRVAHRARVTGPTKALPADMREQVRAALRRGDLPTALKLFREAADEGDADAQYNLSVAYGEGIGVPQDQRIADEWCRKAAEQGEADAQLRRYPQRTRVSAMLAACEQCTQRARVVPE
jgi:Sel1 repeat